MSSQTGEALDDNYARAGYHASQVWGRRPALILIDFAHAYYDPAAPLFGGEGVRTALDCALRLREVARACGIPTILTEVKYRKGGADGGVFFRKAPPLSCFVEGEPTQAFANRACPLRRRIRRHQAISERVFRHEPRRIVDGGRRRYARADRASRLPAACARPASTA